MSLFTRNLARQANTLRRSAWGIRHESSVASGVATPASGSTEAEEILPATHYRITLRRSGIGMPEKLRRTLTAMGLHRRLQSIYRPIGADVAGSILAVKELVHVENVRRLQPEDQVGLEDVDAVWVNELGALVDPGKASKKAPRGYTIVGNIASEMRDLEIKQGRAK